MFNTFIIKRTKEVFRSMYIDHHNGFIGYDDLLLKFSDVAEINNITLKDVKNISITRK